MRILKHKQSKSPRERTWATARKRWRKVCQTKTRMMGKETALEMETDCWKGPRGPSEYRNHTEPSKQWPLEIHAALGT